MKDVVYCQSIAVPRIYKDREQINVQNQCTLQIKMISLVKNTSISPIIVFLIWHVESLADVMQEQRGYMSY